MLYTIKEKTYLLMLRIVQALYWINWPRMERKRINAIDAKLYPDVMNERMYKEQCWCVVKAIINNKGKKQTILCNPISMDKTTLGMRLDMNKETSVYINPKNRKEYFLSWFS